MSGKAMNGVLLRAWRRRTGRTQEEAARDLGLSRRMLAYYEGGEHEVPRSVLLAARALERGLEPLAAPAPGARERWVAAVDDLRAYGRGDPVVGKLMRQRERARLGAFLAIVASGPDPRLAMTDPALFRTLQAACTRAQLAGLGRYRLQPEGWQPTAGPDGPAADADERDEDAPAPRM